MNVFRATEENIKKAAGILQRGGLVAFPTETVYGLGADALDASAVVKIFEAKNRPQFDPLIVHIADISELDMIVTQVSPDARRLIDAFWPGPLTLVLPKKETVPDIATSGLPTVAVRMPSHPVALTLIRETGRPLAAPSANPFGYLSPTSAMHVYAQLGERVDMILDGGQCTIGVESTILRIDDDGALLLRPGGLPLEDIEGIIGKVRLNQADPEADPQAPGMLRYHYSPKAPVRIIHDIAEIGGGDENAGLLAFSSPPRGRSFRMIEVLSAAGDLREAAMNLFSCLHRLDGAGLDVIYAEALPQKGLGRAIMNRLCKAAGEAE